MVNANGANVKTMHVITNIDTWSKALMNVRAIPMIRMNVLNATATVISRVSEYWYLLLRIKYAVTIQNANNNPLPTNRIANMAVVTF